VATALTAWPTRGRWLQIASTRDRIVSATMTSSGGRLGWGAAAIRGAVVTANDTSIRHDAVAAGGPLGHEATVEVLGRRAWMQRDRGVQQRVGAERRRRIPAGEDDRVPGLHRLLPDRGEEVWIAAQ